MQMIPKDQLQCNKACTMYWPWCKLWSRSHSQMWVTASRITSRLTLPSKYIAFSRIKINQSEIALKLDVMQTPALKSLINFNIVLLAWLLCIFSQVCLKTWCMYQKPLINLLSHIQKQSSVTHRTSLSQTCLPLSLMHGTHQGRSDLKTVLLLWPVDIRVSCGKCSD